METIESPFQFEVGGTHLRGLMVHPRTARPRAVIHLLSGSGPQDRDQSIAGHRPFRRLAHELGSGGFAVARWDDRGVGESGGDYQSVDANQLVEDVGHAMRQTEHVLGPGRQVLVGHSQGTIIGTQAAVRYSDRVSALVLLAPMLVEGRRGLLQQHEAICRAEGWDEEAVAASLAFKTEAFDLLTEAQSAVESGDDPVRVQADLAVNLRQWATGGQKKAAFSSDQLAEIECIVDDLLEWEWRFLLSVNPAQDLSAVRCPVLAVFGGSDTQVDMTENVRVWNQCMSQRGRADLRVLSEHNHLFQQCRSGRPSDYSSETECMSPLPVNTLRQWLAAAVQAPP